MNHIQNAQQSLRTHRLRSALTMLGVTIGVASITAIMALGSGASSIVGRQVDALGGNLAVIRPASDAATIDDLSRLPARQGFAASTLTETDLYYLKDIPHLEALAPLMILSGGVKGASVAPSGTAIVATTPDLATVNGLVVQDGQFLDDNLEDVAVIGPQLSVDIFGTEAAIGKRITVKGESFTIVGVLKRTNDPINYNGVDFDRSVIIDQESGRALNQGSLQIQQINLKSDSVAQLEQVIIDANKTLLQTHDRQPDFTVLSGDDVAQPTSQLFMAIAGATTAIAGISLLVGGIGIMNIMLVSVAERTREIGIRKALGASNGDIVAQFLIESLLLGVGGGVGGYVLGYLAAFTISTFLTFDPSFTWQTAAIAVGISLSIGIVFGLYPALRAARKDPIAALRQYD
jgi:ABC-type antimicrobial peptide transport system permease subunit